MGPILGSILNWAIEIYILVIVIDVILSYILSPYHRVREFFDRLVQPVLAPIRRVVPTIGMLDLSPLVLLIGLQLVGGFVVSILYRLP